MKRTYKTPKAIHVDFQYEEQVRADSGYVSGYGDSDRHGYCQQNSPTSCRQFWFDSTYCASDPWSLRPSK